MADTVSIDISKSGWTDVSLLNQNGYLTNNTQHQLRYRIGETVPLDSDVDGHFLNPQAQQPFYLTGAEKMYARGEIEDGRVVVTPGLSLSKDGSFSRDFLTEVNKGNVPGHKLVHKFGSNPNTGTTLETVWTVGGIIQWLQSAETMSVISTDTTNDISTGDNARTIKITGLDTDFNEITEIVTLASTAVTTTKSFRRILTLEVDTVGTYGVTNSGTINITASTSGTPQGQIVATEGRSSQTPYTVPAGYSAFIIRFSMSMDTGKAVNVNLHNRRGADVVTAPFTPHLHLHHWDGLDTPITGRFLANHKLAEKTDVWFDAAATSTSVSIDVDYDILLVKN